MSRGLRGTCLLCLIFLLAVGCASNGARDDGQQVTRESRSPLVSYCDQAPLPLFRLYRQGWHPHHEPTVQPAATPERLVGDRKTEAERATPHRHPARPSGS